MIIRHVLFNFRSSFNNVVLSFPRKRESRYDLGTGFRVKHGMTANIRLQKLYILLFALFSLLYTSYFLPSNAYASAEWQVTLRVEAGKGYNRLVLGADETATDGYDNVWEVYALLDGEIQAYFPHPEWNMAHEVFWRDIKAHAPGSTKEWLFEIKSSLNNINNNKFTIKWDISKIPDNYTISLIDDSTGQKIDMRSTTSYTFFYTGSMTSPMTFMVAVTVPPDVIPPAAPVGLRATTSWNKRGVTVTLHWPANKEDNISGYNVYRSLTSGRCYERMNGSLVLNNKRRLVYHIDKGLDSGKIYYYVVTAVNTSGVESGYSNEVMKKDNKKR
jgi:hypothetical protein